MEKIMQVAFVVILALVLSIAANLYLLVRINRIEQLLFNGSVERYALLDQPIIEHDFHGLQELEQCVSERTQYIEELKSEGKILSVYHLLAKPEIDLAKLVYELNNQSSFYVAQIIEANHELTIELERPGVVSDQAYLECLMERQSFYSSGSWGMITL